LTKSITKPRRDWVTKAAETGDWSQREGMARKALARSRAEILKSRSGKDDRGKVRTFEGHAWEKEPEPSLADDKDERRDEPLADEASPVDDEEDALPEDQEEARLARRETIEEVLGPKANQGWVRRDHVRSQERSQRLQREHEERKRKLDEMSDEEWAAYVEAQDNRAEETRRRIDQEDWARRRNWAGVTWPHPEEDPSPENLPIYYPSWRWTNYGYRMTGIVYNPRRPKGNRHEYRPVEARGVPLKGVKTGRPLNPNKLTDAEKQKRYRERLKLKKQTA
jgi:hypothetical protein